MNSITREDTPVTIEDGELQVRTTSIGGDLTVGFFRLPAGTDLAPALVGLEGDLCQCPHWGYMLKGRLAMTTPDGEEIYEAGEAFYWAPGHAPRALEDCEYVDFSPTVEFQHVLDHITSGAAASA